MSGKWIAGLALALATMLAAAGRQSPPWEKTRLRAGQALYRENCAVCHDIDQQKSTKFGPSFYRLFQGEKMPLSHAKVSREYIKVRIQFGGQLMPAFKQKLSDAEINLLIDYLASK